MEYNTKFIKPTLIEEGRMYMLIFNVLRVNRNINENASLWFEASKDAFTIVRRIQNMAFKEKRLFPNKDFTIQTIIHALANRTSMKESPEWYLTQLQEYCKTNKHRIGLSELFSPQECDTFLQLVTRLHENYTKLEDCYKNINDRIPALMNQLLNPENTEELSDAQVKELEDMIQTFSAMERDLFLQESFYTRWRLLCEHIIACKKNSIPWHSLSVTYINLLETREKQNEIMQSTMKDIVDTVGARFL